MWFFNEFLSFSSLANLLGFFYVADYSTNFVVQNNVNIVEKRLEAQSFEFPQPVMQMANSLAQNRFPDAFLFGAASSAYQIEGAHDVLGKGESVWDYWTRTNPKYVVDKSNGNVACNSFYRYPEDVQLIKNLGANVYRMSLSWSRILPNGLSNHISFEGISYYNALINMLILNGITPMVTLHHYDIPYPLQLMGGWTNPNMVEHFENFAKIAFTYFGDRVKYWITINDPWELCNEQFGDPVRPIFNDTGVGGYLCGHYVLLAHAKVYRMYHREFAWTQKGKVGVSIGTRWFEPEDPTSPDDVEAAELSFQFANYWFLNPLLHEHGDYPDVMKITVDVKSKLQRFKLSRLPIFSPQEIDLIKYSVDFVGINYFTTYNARVLETSEEKMTSLKNAADLKASVKGDMVAEWSTYNDEFGSFEIKNCAKNFGKLLRRLNNDYVLPRIYITANGYADFGEIYDLNRAVYHYDHLQALLEAMKNGVDVGGYMAWSLMDSFEWRSGYTKRFGLYGVDFKDPRQKRKEKLSVKVMQYIYKSKTLPATVLIHDE